MKWLNSLDGLLYEVMSWLVFFPLTLARSLFRPIGIMREIGREEALPDDQRYKAMLSPPLFLALVLLLGHGLATALGEVDQIIANRNGLANLVNDNASALVLRVIVFAAFPLFLATMLVRRSGKRLDRDTLQRPFYEQCYPAAVFALGQSISGALILDRHPSSHTAGHVLMAASFLYFWAVETVWFSKVLGISRVRAAGAVFLGLLQGVLFMIALGVLFTR